MPIVVVLPVPLTPTMRMTFGWVATAIGRSAAANTARISCFTRSRSPAPLRVRPLTAAMMRSVAATPMSAEISSSSSASTVSTSTGRDRRSGASAHTDDLVEPLDDLLLGARKALADPAEDSHRSIMTRFPLPPAAAAASARRAQSARRSGRRALRPSGWRSAARPRSVRRAPAPRRVVRTPSAIIFMPARMSCSDRPRASSIPTWRLRLESTRCT